MGVFAKAKVRNNCFNRGTRNTKEDYWLLYDKIIFCANDSDYGVFVDFYYCRHL